MKKVINSLIDEVHRLQLKQAQLENQHKILKTEAMRIKTMSDRYLPTIGEMMGNNGRKGA